MIVLTRKCGRKRKGQQSERIVIDLRNVDMSKLTDADKIITVEIVEANALKGRIGINAAKAIPVDRSEVWEVIERDGRKAPTDAPLTNGPESEAA